MKVNNNVSTIGKASCFGCGVCSVSCYQNAITMVENIEGFVYPCVSSELCTGCGKCVSVCPAYRQEKDNTPITGFAAVNRNHEQLSKSASGGVFSSIAAEFLRQGGVVCGAASFFENSIPIIKHIIVTEISELDKLQGSKYVQSDIKDILKPIRDYLKQDKKVLFTGTPCQVEGVRKFLGENNDNFYAIDLICHGVPNNKLFSMYSLYLKKKYGGEILEFCFRDKEYGWGKNGSLTVRRSGIIYKIAMPCHKSSFYYFLMSSNLQRESCFSCPYASEHRAGDLTVGDYWGIEDMHPEIMDEIDISKGISCILVNSNIGSKLLSKYGNGLFTINTGSKDIIAGNDRLRSPAKKGKYRNMIYRLAFPRGGYWTVEVLFLIFKIKSKAQRVLKKVIHVYTLPGKIK